MRRPLCLACCRFWSTFASPSSSYRTALLRCVLAKSSDNSIESRSCALVSVARSRRMEICQRDGTRRIKCVTNKAHCCGHDHRSIQGQHWSCCSSRFRVTDNLQRVKLSSSITAGHEKPRGGLPIDARPCVIVRCHVNQAFQRRWAESTKDTRCADVNFHEDEIAAEAGARTSYHRSVSELPNSEANLSYRADGCHWNRTQHFAIALFCQDQLDQSKVLPYEVSCNSLFAAMFQSYGVDRELTTMSINFHWSMLFML